MASSFASAPRALLAPSPEDACARNVSAAPVVSSFYGQRIRCSRSGMDSQRKGRGLWTSFAAKVVVDGAALKTEASTPDEDKSPLPSPPVPEPKSPNTFFQQVISLIKLAGKYDLGELHYKFNDNHVIIKNVQPLPPPPVVNQPYTVLPPAPAPAYVGPPSDAITTPEVKPESVVPTPNYPTFNSPMAGTFYRSPGPGEAAFVKVGDKVKKNQVVCIVEAMKTMNTIEVDQDGTIVEILAEDGKPVSADSPLFRIQP